MTPFSSSSTVIANSTPSTNCSTTDDVAVGEGVDQRGRQLLGGPDGGGTQRGSAVLRLDHQRQAEVADQQADQRLPAPRSRNVLCDSDIHCGVVKPARCTRFLAMFFSYASRQFFDVVPR